MSESERAAFTLTGLVVIMGLITIAVVKSNNNAPAAPMAMVPSPVVAEFGSLGNVVNTPIEGHDTDEMYWRLDKYPGQLQQYGIFNGTGGQSFSTMPYQEMKPDGISDPIHMRMAPPVGGLASLLY